jgi:hypothetical protein
VPRIQDAEIGRALARKFGLKGAPDFSTLAPEIVPVVVVAKLAADVDIERPAMGFAAPAAVAGQYSNVQLYNPADSGIIATLEGFVAEASSDFVIQVTERNADNGSPVSTVVFRDSRVRGSPACVINANTNTGVIGNLKFSIAALARQPVQQLLGWTLEPGDGITVGCATVNLQMRTNLFWTERSVRAED